MASNFMQSASASLQWVISPRRCISSWILLNATESVGLSKGGKTVSDPS